MPRVVPPGFKRDHLAKTGVREIESKMLREIADRKGGCPADVVYLAVVKLLREEFPAQCERHKVGSSLLVG